MRRVLHLPRGFCSSASPSLPTDDPSTHHLARCPGLRSPPQVLTFGAALGARGPAPAVAALPPAHIDPAGTANSKQWPAGHDSGERQKAGRIKSPG